MLVRFLSALMLQSFILMFTRHTACGQVKRGEIPFPTYQQIKPSHSEIIDQVPAQRVSATGGQVNASRLTSFNLYNYPAGTVTYYLNEQPTTDVNYVKGVLGNKSIVVETISIEPPAENGKRTIRIKYEAR